jgi:hypothetical protein
MFINYDYEYEYQQQVITCKQIAITIAKTIASKKYKKLRQKATEFCNDISTTSLCRPSLTPTFANRPLCSNQFEQHTAPFPSA